MELKGLLKEVSSLEDMFQSYLSGIESGSSTGTVSVYYSSNRTLVELKVSAIRAKIRS